VSGISIRRNRVDSGRAFRQAERECARLARREARNFYWGFLALPRPRRTAIYALYGFARQVDDEADSPDGGAAAGLARQRERLHACQRDIRHDPVMLVLGQAIERYAIPLSELEELIDGVEMDLRRRRYRDWQDLSAYCRLVAGSIGRICVRIFGYSNPAALRHADQLGLALQLTNILRDVTEDVRMDRVYLPQDELERFGLPEAELFGPRPGVGWEKLVAFEVMRARRLYDEGLQVCRYVPPSSASCIRTMAGIYRHILERIAINPRRALTTRVSLSTPEKLGVAARSWLSSV
jgi:15-cis-phytoene synthase